MLTSKIDNDEKEPAQPAFSGYHSARHGYPVPKKFVMLQTGDLVCGANFVFRQRRTSFNSQH